IQFEWDKMPVGGRVKFLIAFYSSDGYLVGKGESQTISNKPTDRGALIVPPITITELPYPLTDRTTYRHDQILRYDDARRHHWIKSATAPRETNRDLETGEGGN